jgi:peptidoglycan L-alanyl-D-glutamate endopeptidase CwlK
MSCSIEDLSSEFKPKATQLLDILKHLGLKVMVLDTLRTLEEQKINIKNGVSWTLHSRHLPDNNGKANAMDIVPLSVINLKNWAPHHPDWFVIGTEAKKLGLRWGGDWKQRDMGHVELPETKGK